MDINSNTTVKTHNICSQVAYLIGVWEENFWTADKKRFLFREVYDELNQKKPARIVRNLCMLRNAIMLYFSKINKEVRKGALPENLDQYLPTACFKELAADGIRLSGKRLVDYLFDINRLVKERIYNCRDIFPDWLCWDYLQDIFVMPGGTTEEGTKEAASVYHLNKNEYPYRVYMNWSSWCEGMMFKNDLHFIDLLYKSHGDKFTETYRLMEITEDTRRNIDSFLGNATKAAMIVDCENVNPYHLFAVLCDLEDQLLQAVDRIILYNDVNTTSTWDFIGEKLSIPVESIMTERVLENKSLLDISLAAGACRIHFKENIDSYILVSSDSDYWGLIEALPEVRFMVLMDRSLCSQKLKDILNRENIFYCFMEDFPLEEADDLREKAVYLGLRKKLDTMLSDLNLDRILDDVILETRAGLSTFAEQELRTRIKRNFRIVSGDDGAFRIELHTK